MLPRTAMPLPARAGPWGQELEGSFWVGEEECPSRIRDHLGDMEKWKVRSEDVTPREITAGTRYGEDSGAGEWGVVGEEGVDGGLSGKSRKGGREVS